MAIIADAARMAIDRNFMLVLLSGHRKTIVGSLSFAANRAYIETKVEESRETERNGTL